VCVCVFVCVCVCLCVRMQVRDCDTLAEHAPAAIPQNVMPMCQHTAIREMKKLSNVMDQESL
jgi:hypothetical protein